MENWIELDFQLAENCCRIHHLLSCIFFAVDSLKGNMEEFSIISKISKHDSKP